MASSRSSSVSAASTRSASRSASTACKQALDQEGIEALGPRPRDPDDGSDDARGKGHAGQDPRPVREGHASAARRSDDPAVAAVCVYPALVPDAKAPCGVRPSRSRAWRRAFPSGQTFREIKLTETRQAVEAGADEIDMVIDRGAFLRGRLPGRVRRDRRGQGSLRPGHLKVILETGELETYDNVRRASILAMAAGADFIKTSTGKITPAATLPVTLVMLEAIRDFDRRTGPRGRHEAGRRDPHGEGSDPVPGRPVRDARAALDDARAVPLRRLAACSTTC